MGRCAPLRPRASIEALLRHWQNTCTATHVPVRGNVSAFGFWFVCRKDRLDEPKIAAFRSWILEQAGKQAPSRSKAYTVTGCLRSAPAKASVVSGPTIAHCTTLNAVSITR
jgi:hypothetical protein